MKSFLVYKFTCASCSSSYIGKTCRHFKIRTSQKGNKSHISKHLHSTAKKTLLNLKIKEALHINWRKPNLDTQQNHLALTLSPQLLPPCSFLSLFFSAFLFHLLFSLSLTLIIDIFYCLNYTFLLLHLITTHLVSHFFFHLFFSLSLR